MSDAPHILPFAPAGDDDAPDDGADELELDFGAGEDLETAYRRALAAVDAVEARPAAAPPAGGGKDDDGGAGPAEGPGESAAPAGRVTPREVVEAALFVGGAGLTAARAGTLLRGNFSDADLAAAVAELNRRYDAEARPYRAVAGADGWELKLRAAFEPIRRKLYGLGPREVSLPTAALEVLSVVAYGQPITRAAVETARDGDAGAALRRLVRLDLLALTKPPPAAAGDGAGDGAGDDGPEGADGGGNPAGGPTYATTERFLDLFGLGSLEDLPRPEDLNFK